jgi:hypothetical protein
MFLRLLAVASVLVTGQASAQPTKSAFAMPREYSAINLGNPRITHETREARECLVEKESRRMICRTRAGWRAIAARLDALQQPATAK